MFLYMFLLLLLYCQLNFIVCFFTMTINFLTSLPSFHTLPRTYRWQQCAKTTQKITSTGFHGGFRTLGLPEENPTSLQTAAI